MGRLLGFAGRHGPLVLFVGVLLGLAVPALAGAAKPLMGAAVFAFTLGAFLKVDGAALRSQLDRPALLLAWLTWLVVGVPLATWAVLAVVPLPAAMKTGLLLCALAPPIGSAAAMAAMLRLDAALALTLSIGAGVLSPLTLPTAALALGGMQLHLQWTETLVRMLCVVGGAGWTATLLRRFAPTFVRDNPSAMTGISVAGLLIVAIGAMRGLPPQLLHHPREIALALLAAFVFNAGQQLVGAALFFRYGATDAITIGLMSGNRNVTLVWVAVLPWLVNAPGVDLMLAASVFPIFMLPLPMSRLLDIARRRGLLGPLVGHAAAPTAPNAAPDFGQRRSS